MFLSSGRLHERHQPRPHPASGQCHDDTVARFLSQQQWEDEMRGTVQRRGEAMLRGGVTEQDASETENVAPPAGSWKIN